MTPGQVSPHLHQIVGGVRSRRLYLPHPPLTASPHPLLECVCGHRSNRNFLLTVLSASTLLWTWGLTYRRRRHVLPVASKKTSLTTGPRSSSSSILTGPTFGCAQVAFQNQELPLQNAPQVPQIANGGTGDSNGGMTVYYIQPATDVPFVSFRKV